jgi:hypothetical protein
MLTEKEQSIPASVYNDTATTQEQLRDVYAAGTSDGIMDLGGGKILHLETKGWETYPEVSAKRF